MDFKTVFLNSLVSPPKLSAGERPEMFLGQTLSWDTEDSSPVFKLLSCGELHVHFPWSFDIRALDCFLFLYTEKGCGKLLLNSQVYSLDAGSFLLLDCNQRFRLDIAVEPWDYQAAFVYGPPVLWYRNLFTKERFALTRVCAYSDLSMSMERLLTLYPGSRTPQKLVIADLINHITTCCITELWGQKKEGLNQIPSYIEAMHTLFDQEFQEIYTLDNLEKNFGISKYRLCREFSAIYGISPLQYLNRRRIEAARHLLLTTDHRIHVIGSMVGIDNTNHFITLFKKYTGNTPLEYRQRMDF